MVQSQFFLNIRYICTIGAFLSLIIQYPEFTWLQSFLEDFFF